MRRLLVLIALVLASCATTSRLDAAGDVHALLVAVRDDDQAAFDRYVDRPALKRQIEGRIVQEARASDAPDGLKALGIALARPAAALASATLIQPYAFRTAAESYGYTPDQPIPGRVTIASALKYLPDGRVCATERKHGDCLLMFTNEGGTWRLTGFEGNLSDLRKRLSPGK
ncbi:MAG: DUF2939 domain-containing protein [Parcubacteria group bacterium]